MYPASSHRTVIHRPAQARVDGASADSGALIPPRTKAPRGAGCHAEGVGVSASRLTTPRCPDRSLAGLTDPGAGTKSRDREEPSHGLEPLLLRFFLISKHLLKRYEISGFRPSQEVESS